MVLDPTTGRQSRDFIASNFTSYGPRDFGFPIRSVEIDNPTGQWLLFKESLIRVPPYVINFRVNIDPSANTLAIQPIPIVGFIGSTPVTDQIRLVVRDYEITPSDGISLTPSQPTTKFAAFGGGTEAGTFDLIPASPTQRVRLYSYGCGYSVFPWQGATPAPLHPAWVQFQIAGFGAWANIILNSEHGSEDRTLGPYGLDLAPALSAILQFTVFFMNNDPANDAVDAWAVYTLI